MFDTKWGYPDLQVTNETRIVNIDGLTQPTEVHVVLCNKTLTHGLMWSWKHGLKENSGAVGPLEVLSVKLTFPLNRLQ